MGIPQEELNRAGLRVVGGGLVRIKDANRPVPKTQAGDNGSDTGDSRENSQLQKQQDADKAFSEGAASSAGIGEHFSDNGATESIPKEAYPDDYQTGVSATDERDDGQHRITITVRFSNRLRTDLSGKLDTILDCIVRARRRLLDKIAGDTHSSGTVRAGKRRRDNRDRANLKGKVPF